MKSIVAIVLIFQILFAAVWAKVDDHALSKFSFLITHSLEHLQEDGFSVWQLICHYVDEWDAESHQPPKQKQDVPFRSHSYSDYTASSLSFEYSFDLGYSDAADLKYSSYLFTATSGYNGSVFHPPKH